MANSEHQVGLMLQVMGKRVTRSLRLGNRQRSGRQAGGHSGHPLSKGC